MTRNSALIAAALCCIAASVDADDLFVVRSISVDSVADDANAYTTIQYMNQDYNYSCYDLYALQEFINASNFSVENA